MANAAQGGESAYTDEDVEFGRWLFAQECRFTLGVTDMHSLPAGDDLEVAFAGRSNVGKSSLLNALTNHRNLARTSHTPGRTQQLNFFSLAERLILVDLPGYGYAKVSKADVAQWTALVCDYLTGRPQLRRLFLLIDARRGIMPADEEIMDLLDSAAVAYQIVLTKADKLKAGASGNLVAQVRAAIAGRPASLPSVCPTSAHKGGGVPELRAEIGRLVRH